MSPKFTPANRRQFLRRSASTAAAISVPYFVPASVLGLEDKPAPSDRIVMGWIGTGGQGRGLLGGFMGQPDVQVVSVCDVDAGHLAQGAAMVNGKYGNQDCQTFGDFRQLLENADIDAVCIATPDHWHALAGIAAAKANKDIYCEKPLVNSVAEGRALCNAVANNNRVLQTGSHERSGNNARFACELVRNGRIGKLHTIRVNLPCSDGHHQQARALQEVPPESALPGGFDYDFWLGHTPLAPYSPQRCHFWWRFVLAYGGGEMTDRGAHVIDIAQLGHGTDDTGPVEITAKGVRSKTSLYDTFFDYEFENVFADGVRMIGSTNEPRGVTFEGADGWISVGIHGGALSASKPEILQEKIGEGEIQLGRSPGHYRNFLDSVKSRQQPVASAEVGHRTASICHLNNIAMLLERSLKWDPVKEQFIGDDEANRLLMPPMRAPWKLS
jgi:predicted dehydrogenase